MATDDDDDDDDDDGGGDDGYRNKRPGDNQTITRTSFQIPQTQRLLTISGLNDLWALRAWEESAGKHVQ